MDVYSPVMADPPLCSYADLVLPGRLTIDDLADMNELLKLRRIVGKKMRQRQESKR